MPPDVEGLVAALWEKGDVARAEPVLRLLAECFPEDAECHNYLGLIALEAGHPAEAVGHFRKTMELGRRLFPKRIAKDLYGRDDRTRPYMRGLRNLALALLRASRWDEALAACDRLDRGCGDRITAMVHRSSVFLDTGRWPEAVGAALSLGRIDPSSSLVAAFALVEVGRHREAVARFLHGALHQPRTARLVLGVPGPEPKSWIEARDHNGGVELRRNLHAYLKSHKRAGLVFLTGVLALPNVAALLQEIEDARRRWFGERSDNRKDFDRMTSMESWEFAQERSREVATALGLPEEAPAPPQPPARRRRGKQAPVH
jgi:tetratricopeptide (TPR) repeat protein